MTDPRKCCILGICCPPGSAEQRASFKSWLISKLLEEGMPEKVHGPGSDVDGTVDAWLDELPWGEPADQPLPPAAAEGVASVIAPVHGAEGSDTSSGLSAGGAAPPATTADSDSGVTTGDLEDDGA